MKNVTWKRDNLCFNLFRTKYTYKSSGELKEEVHTAMTLKRKLATATISRWSSYTRLYWINMWISVCMCVCFFSLNIITCVYIHNICVVTQSIYMAPNHKRENPIKSIIKSVLGHSAYVFQSLLAWCSFAFLYFLYRSKMHFPHTKTFHFIRNFLLNESLTIWIHSFAR